MERPAEEVTRLIKTLTQGSVAEQTNAVHRYFLPTASFVHPFCRVPSFSGRHIWGLGEVDSRSVILLVYQWYKVLSPKIELQVESAVFDEANGILYVSINQVFALWFVPFYRAPVRLVTVLYLEKGQAPDSSIVTPSFPNEQDPAPRSNGDGPSYAHVASQGSAALEQGPAKASTGDDAVTRPSRTRYMIRKQDDLYQVNDFLGFLLPGVGPLAYGVWQVFSTGLCAVGFLVLGPITYLLLGLNLIHGQDSPM